MGGHEILRSEAIKNLIPYKEPFLFIDEVLELDSRKIICSLRVREVEGHFVDHSIMPGSLLMEGFGQAGTLLVRHNIEDELKDILLYSVKDFKFFKPTYPGEKVKFDIDLKYLDDKFAIVDGKILGDELKGEGLLILAIVDKEKFRK
tara:strand:- start:114 stop:554 length:441 start_codon:yes stop_codon:yes gene_type:complete